MSKKEIKVLGIVPARGGSKSIPHKNIALLAGKPLIYYTIKSAQKSRKLDAFIVSTDDEKIACVARSLGADVPFLRPKNISGDNATDIQFLKHALAWLGKNRNWYPEIVVLLRPTTPLRTSKDIDEVINFMIKENCDSVRTVSLPNPYNPYKMWTMADQKKGGIKPLLATKYFKTLGTDIPRQWLPAVYWQNAVVDATRAKFITRENRVYGPDIRGFMVNPEKAIDIDSHKDLAIAETIIKYDRRTKRALL
ncbi:MAG: acylneuraminate cytidylyltransferase family protein [Patescibacteria group bacterium]